MQSRRRRLYRFVTQEIDVNKGAPLGWWLGAPISYQPRSKHIQRLFSANTDKKKENRGLREYKRLYRFDLEVQRNEREYEAL